MNPTAQIGQLKQKISSKQLPPEILEKLQNELMRLELLLKANSFSLELDRHISYIDFVLSLPWNEKSADILDLPRAKAILNKNHFGLESVKERSLEYLSVLILNQRKGQSFSSSTLTFVGLVGSGKTTLAYSIAESLGRPIERVPFGGLGSAMQLRGESRIKPEAEAGLIIKALQKCKVKNPVILLDEIDRVALEARTDVMGVLVELLDPSQNHSFLDYYVDLRFDLSQVLFIATANNLNNISTAVLDRLEIIEMPFYSDQQKITIAKDYLLPKALNEAGINSNMIVIDPNLWVEIVRPLGFDGGTRSLKRTIEQIVRKVAKQIVEGGSGPFQINSTNMNLYINK